jgi:hypothetical protein
VEGCTDLIGAHVKMNGAANAIETTGDVLPLAGISGSSTVSPFTGLPKVIRVEPAGN